MYCDRVTAHRGGARHAPENTIPAFRHAAELGARWIETDVCLLGDGTPILFHDPTFDRRTGRTGAVRTSTWADARALDAGGGFGDAYAGTPIPRLDEALPQIAALGLGLNLELKLHEREREALVETVLPIVDRLWPDERRLIVSSFDAEGLALVRERRPRTTLGYICRDIPADWQAMGERLALLSFHPDYRNLHAQTARAVAAAGYELYAYTPNAAEDVTDMWDWGLTGVITDDLDAFSDWLHPPAQAGTAP